MSTLMKALTTAAAICVASTAAHAVSVMPFDTPLSAGDNTLGNAVASPFENFGLTSLSLTAANDLTALVSITVNPFLTDVQGSPANSIGISYAINGGSMTALPITAIATPPIGFGGLTQNLLAGDVLSFFVSGTAGQSGNQVTFAVETAPIPVPAALLFGMSGLGAFAALRRRKKA